MGYGLWDVRTDKWGDVDRYGWPCAVCGVWDVAVGSKSGDALMLPSNRAIYNNRWLGRPVFFFAFFII